MIESPTVETSSTSAPFAAMSLAEYREQREGAVTTEQEEAATSSEGESSPNESAALDNADDTTEHQEGTKPAKKGGFQRKIEAKDREIEQLKRQLADHSAAPAEKQEPATPPAAPPILDKPKPKLDEFDSIEEFTEALSDWKADERDAKRAQKEAQSKRSAEWNSRQDAAKQTHADYDDVLAAASAVMLTPAHQRLFLESEAGAELAYQLAKNPADLKKFADMDPLQAARYFGRLEARHSSDDTPEPVTRTSNAPKPIRPVGARSNGAAAPADFAKLSLSDYRRLRDAGKLR